MKTEIEQVSDCLDELIRDARVEWDIWGENYYGGKLDGLIDVKLAIKAIKDKESK